MIKLTQEHIEALLDKFGGEHNPPSIYLEVSLCTNECGYITGAISTCLYKASYVKSKYTCKSTFSLSSRNLTLFPWR